MNSYYKYPLIIIGYLVILSVAGYFGVVHYVILGFLGYNCIQKTRKKDWKGLKQYLIYMAVLYGAILLGINIILVMIGFLLFKLVMSKNRKYIFKHPILTYEYAYMQMQAAWSTYILGIMPNVQLDGIKRTREKSLERIKNIEQRGVKFEFLQDMYE